MKRDTVDWCKGRWRFVLTSFGVEAGHLRNIHGPCPVCGGDDRFRFDDKDGRGTWFCNQCGNGDGFDLLSQFTGRNFQSLAKEIESDLMHVAPEKSTPIQADRSVEQKAVAMNRVWRQARSSQLVDDYLKHRGLKRRSDLVDLRGNMELPFIDQKTKMRDKFPAMLALVRNGKGKPIGVHRTYLMPDGQRIKKMMSPIENMMGGAVRLLPIMNRTVLVAEGIESALAGRELISRASGAFGVYAALSAKMMAGVQLDTSSLDTVIICADADRSFTGEACAYQLANRLAVSKNAQLRVQVWTPERRECDMVDVLEGKCDVRMVSNV